jgi:hypothetical protein
LQWAIRARRGREIEIQPEFTLVGEDKVIGSTRWLDPDGETQERFQVLTIRDGRIADMQGCKSRREAERFARRRRL